MSETVTGGARTSLLGGGKEPEAAGIEAPRKADGKKSKGKLIVAGLATLILVGGGATVLEKAKLFRVASERTQAALHPPIMLGIPTIVSNLDSGDGRPVYVKLTAKVEIQGANDEASLQNTVPEIQDIFQTYLHETRPQDIRGDGIYRLREAITRRLRITLLPLQVTNVYFVEFLVQ
ncbi:flagellar basal body-associated FliL family protein [Gluconacetobacter azotocaptans]|uniref:flagellar basal body-associated FliL family protein n=1 Tax=Gluconacetobacter azotocaptans TaxID=142834 RepID=UPI001958E6B2|nr:flagellar basal body-associated FliL family protein [Gluconacetobacter azotocaptans]MBM9402643.1 flagellar basal body-associated FliL family protein [Gluconacetobacter azotocaptans]